MFFYDFYGQICPGPPARRRAYLSDVPAAEPAAAAGVSEVLLVSLARELVVAGRYVASALEHKDQGKVSWSFNFANVENFDIKKKISSHYWNFLYNSGPVGTYSK